MQRHAALLRGALEAAQHAPVVGLVEIDVIILGDADQRIEAREIDVIGDGHGDAGHEVGAKRARRAGQQHRLRAHQRHRFQRIGHTGGIARFVEMRAPLQIGDANALLHADDHHAGMAGRMRLRKTGQFRIGRDDRVKEPIRQRRKAGAGDDGDLDRPAAVSRQQIGCGFR
jgi:hypothetical protein